MGSFGTTQIPLLDVHELAAGKLAALFGRSASRDLFDVRELLQRVNLDRDKLRLGFVVYGGINRRDWRSVSLTDLAADPDEVDRQLLPLLRGPVAPPRDRIAEWAGKLVADCRNLLSTVLPLAANELEFIERLNQRGEIVTEILTDDKEFQTTIRSHPGLLWKALNVRKYHRLIGTEEEWRRSNTF